MIDVGDKLGDYEIVARLKAGGMATLFLARRQGAAGFARHVAIKVVHAHLSGDKQFVQMFVDEALLCARIQHPNVVHVEELGDSDGMYFLVMEYVHGASLGQMIRALAKKQRRLAPEYAVQIAMQILDGLHAAHEVSGDDGELLGVVHRDVSPQNVLLSYKGHVKLIDFGIAKAKGRVQQTTGASLKGKIRYMSPEQAFGRAVDRRTDIYALAIVLWEMLTMRNMFQADNDFALLDMVRAPEFVPPSRYAPAIPPALDRALQSALATNADDRPATAEALRNMLAEAVPAAWNVRPSQLADLMNTVMAGHIEKERRALPESMSGWLKMEGGALPRGQSSRGSLPGGPPMAPVVDADEVLKTMTLAASEIHLLDDFDQSDADRSQPSESSAPIVARVPRIRGGLPTGASSGIAFAPSVVPAEPSFATGAAAAGVTPGPDVSSARGALMGTTPTVLTMQLPAPGATRGRAGTWIAVGALVAVGLAAGGLALRAATTRSESVTNGRAATSGAPAIPAAPSAAAVPGVPAVVVAPVPTSQASALPLVPAAVGAAGGIAGSGSRAVPGTLVPGGPGPSTASALAVVARREPDRRRGEHRPAGTAVRPGGAITGTTPGGTSPAAAAAATPTPTPPVRPRPPPPAGGGPPIVEDNF